METWSKECQEEISKVIKLASFSTLDTIPMFNRAFSDAGINMNDFLDRWYHYENK